MYKSILVPVAFDNEHDGQAAISVAERLKSPDGAITFLHVMEAIPNLAVGYVPEAVLAESREKLAKDLEALAAGVAGATSTKIVSGHAGRAIVDVADEDQIECIVIRSHRPGIEDYFLGSTAARVVRHASCSVHVIR